MKCCQDTQGCFALASYGVGITAMFDKVHAEEDGSNSVNIRGGRRFLVREGSARVVPGTFGLTVVEPNYIYVSFCPSCVDACVVIWQSSSVHELVLRVLSLCELRALQ